MPFARFGDPRHLERKLFAHRQTRADFALFSGTHQHFPFVERKPFQQQNFDFRSVGVYRKQPRRHHLRIIDNEHVALAQIIDDIAKRAVLDLLFRAAVYQQARRIARLRRRLGDQLFGQIVIKIRSFQHDQSPSPKIESCLRAPSLMGMPICSYPFFRHTLPRGVRARNPSCNRYGS